MALYAEADVLHFLRANNFDTDGDSFGCGTGWYSPSGLAFTMPDPIAMPGLHGLWYDADVIDRIFSDKWIWIGPLGLPRRLEPGS